MKYILVTGGSRGIGRAICIRLVSLGMPIIINYNSNHSAANETKSLIEDLGGKAELMPFNVSDKVEVEKAINNWEQTHPDDYIAVLVNNAGVRRDNVMFMMSDEDWHQVIDTTLDGFFYITRCLLKHMMPRKRGGRIINVASLSGIKGLPGQTNYSAAKAALIGATKALAQEVASRNITVNAIAPGFIDTGDTAVVVHVQSVRIVLIILHMDTDCCIIHRTQRNRDPAGSACFGFVSACAGFPFVEGNHCHLGYADRTASGHCAGIRLPIDIIAVGLNRRLPDDPHLNTVGCAVLVL